MTKTTQNIVWKIYSLMGVKNWICFWHNTYIFCIKISGCVCFCCCMWLYVSISLFVCVMRSCVCGIVISHINLLFVNTHMTLVVMLRLSQDGSVVVDRRASSINDRLVQRLALRARWEHSTLYQRWAARSFILSLVT